MTYQELFAEVVLLRARVILMREVLSCQLSPEARQALDENLEVWEAMSDDEEPEDTLCRNALALLLDWQDAAKKALSQ